MMTTEERVRDLHARMDERKRLRERRITGLTGTACAVLAAFLILLTVSERGTYPGGPAGMYSGSVLLFEGAGAYVLVAVIAFMAGVVVTVACIISKKKRSGEQPRFRSGFLSGIAGWIDGLRK